jgi:glycosyltransferase involved in cell wall biosynthesis
MNPVMPTRPFISVIMPVYNGQEYLAASLDSLSCQSDVSALEVIAVDDGSTDNTVAILKSYQGRFPLRIVEGVHAGNWVAGANKGLDLATGEFVSILHQDDLWAPGRLAALRDWAGQHGEVDVFLAPSLLIDPQGRSLGLWSCPLPHHGRPLPPSQWFPPLFVQNYISMPAPVIRRKALLKLSRMDESVVYTADWKLWLSVASVCQAVYTPSPFTSFRIHPFSQTIQCIRNLTDYRRQMQTVVDEFLPVLSRCATDSERWRRLAQYSIEVNVALAAHAQGVRQKLGLVFWHGLRMGFRDFHLYVTCSRIRERVMSRLKAGFTFCKVERGKHE